MKVSGKIISILLVILMLFSGCSNDKLFYNGEQLLNVELSVYNMETGQNDTCKLSREEITEYLNLYDVQSKELDLISGTLYGGPEISVSLETDNKFYYHRFSLLAGAIMLDHEYCFTNRDNPLFEFVSRILEKNKISNNTFNALKLTGGYDFASDGVYPVILTLGDANAADVVACFGLDSNKAATIAEFVENNTEIKKLNDIATLGSVEIKQICSDPLTYSFTNKSMKMVSYDELSFNDPVIEKTEKGIVEHVSLKHNSLKEHDLKYVMDLSDYKFYSGESPITVDLNEGDFEVRFESENISAEELDGLYKYGPVLQGTLFIDGMINSKLSVAENIPVISMLEDNCSDSLKYVYDHTYNMRDAEPAHFENGRRYNDFVLGIYDIVAYDGQKAECLISIRPFYRINYDIDKIYAAYEDGTIVNYNGQELCFNTDYHWKDLNEMEALVFAFTANKAELNNIYVHVEYNDGKESVMPLKEGLENYYQKEIHYTKYLGRSDVMEVISTGKYLNLFKANEIDKILNYENGIVPSAFAVRLMGNDKASKLFNGKNLSELTASWGEPIRTSANEVAYMGCFCDDEIVIKTENNKVTGVDYVNICKGRIVSVNKNEIMVSIEMPEKNGHIHSYHIIYSMYNRNISNQEKEKFKEGKAVIVKYRGMAYEASPSEIEISVVE